MKIIFGCSFAVLMLFTVSSSAQKNTNIELSTKLKTYPENKKAQVVANRFISSYRFLISSNRLQVVREDEKDLISLESNYDHVESVFYNDNLKIEEFNAAYASGKSIWPKNSCGNYEVEDIFYSDSKVCAYKLSFLYEATEISTRSRVRYDDPKYLTTVFFHEDEPVESREISFEIPQEVEVDLIERNFEKFKINKNVQKVGNKMVYKYSVNRLAAVKQEENSLGYLHFYPHIIVATKSYTTSKGKNKVLSSVDDLYNWYNSLVLQVKNDPLQLKAEVDRLTINSKTDLEKIKTIYYWIQDNIKYIAFEDGIAGFKPEAAHQVYLNRYGDCKGMANLTKEMLKLAGFDARLTWIGTNRIPYTYDIPSLSVDNHMICTVLVGDQLYVLDATEKYISLGKNADRIQGKEMLIEDGTNFIRRNVPVSNEIGNLIDRTEVVVLENGNLKGEGELLMNGESKKSVLYFSTNVKHEDQKRLFSYLAVSDYINTDKVEVVKAPDIDRDVPLHMNYKFELGNKVSSFNNDIYVDLDWNKTYQNLTMEEDRLTDFYFNRKVKTRTAKRFKVPAGYVVSHIPVSMSKVFDDFSFLISFKLIDNEIHYSNEITVHEGIVKKDRFTTWNECIKQLKEIYSDQVVITKK
jgi:transglutaminase-like putative cysteine protease